MAVRLTRFGLVLGVVVAMVVIIRVITTGVGRADIRSESAAPIASKQTIYRSQLRNLF
jgi:hypothetical protein